MLGSNKIRLQLSVANTAVIKALTFPAPRLDATDIICTKSFKKSLV